MMPTNATRPAAGLWGLVGGELAGKGAGHQWPIALICGDVPSMQANAARRRAVGVEQAGSGPMMLCQVEWVDLCRVLDYTDLSNLELVSKGG